MRAVISIVLLMGMTMAGHAADRIDFWNKPQYGANCFNESPPGPEYFRALRGYGATWTRLTFSKWKSARKGDFLFGSLDDFQALVPEDLATLRKVLDAAQAEGIAVVLTPLELPGARWVQQNNGKFDDRLWSDQRFWRQSAAFWRDLATALKDHPAIAAYNFINEPVPEKKGGLEEHATVAQMQAWNSSVHGSARDLPAFYQLLLDQVRAVDAVTPVMLDAGYYAAADALAAFPAPLSDARVLYAYHMYEPWLATSTPNLKAKVPYRYPGAVPFGGRDVEWDAARIAAYLHQPVDWARAHGVPVSRLVAAEFGCVRVWADCPQYLDDVLKALDADGVHWAFYSFRESWDGMDYELGPDKLPWQYWQAVGAGKPYALKRGPNKVFDPIQRRLARNLNRRSP